MNNKMRKQIIAALALLTLMPATSTSAELRVVTTIKPIHALVAGVMASVSDPYLIVKGSATPHAYALKPSDAAALQQAQVVFRIGGSIEKFLDGAIRNSATTASVVSFIKHPRLRRLPYRKGVQWGSANHEGHGHDGHNHDSQGHKGRAPSAEDATNTIPGRKQTEHEPVGRESNIDPHIWLAPENAIAIVDIIAATLTKAAPSQSATFARNATNLSARLRQLEADIRAQTASLHEKPFLVFHDAFQYFEVAFNIEAAGAISLGDGRAPGAMRIRSLQRELKSRHIACVFAEPQFEPKIINAVIANTGARRGILDPIGADIEPGPEAFFTLMQRNATALVKCLGTS